MKPNFVSANFHMIRTRQIFRNFWPLFVILTVSAFFFLLRLNRDLLVDWDECVYSVQAIEMKETGNYLTNQWNGIVDLQKPPLYTLLLQLPYQFAVNEFTTRIISVILGLALMAVVYLFCAKFFSQQIAIPAVLLLLASELFLYMSIRANTDIGFTFLVFCGACFWVISWEKDRYSYLSGVAFGLAVMMKGLGVLPVLFALFLSIFINPTRNKLFAYGKVILSFLIIILPWHVIEYLRYGNQFAEEYFFSSILKRSSFALESHEGPWYKFLSQFKQMLFPWIFLGILFPFKFVWKLFSESFREVLKREEIMITLCFIMGVTLFSISSMKTKLPWYSLPIYPFLAIYLSTNIQIAIQPFKTRRWVYFLMVGVLILDAGYSLARENLIFESRREINTRQEVYIRAASEPQKELHYLLGESPRTRILNYRQEELLPNTMRFGGNPCAVHYSRKKVKYYYYIDEFQDGLAERNRLFLIRNEDLQVIANQTVQVLFRNKDYTLFKTGR